jgi:CHRD domain/RTX calcium-binding nonapeptide repeat (4 copies)
MPSFTITTGNSLTTRQDMSGTDVGTVQIAGTLSVSANAQSIRFNGPTTNGQVANFGLIENTAAGGRAIRFETSVGAALTASVLNQGTIQSIDDAIQIQAGSVTSGTMTITNNNLIQSTDGQAIDFAGGTGTSAQNITNTGNIVSVNSDAIRIGGVGNIQNTGTINGGTAAAYSVATDGIQFELGSSGSVTNTGTGVVAGDRHGINAGLSTTVTVVNLAGGTITGRNGSGVGLDGNGTVNNFGTITGAFSNSPGSDINGSTVGAPNGGGPDTINDGDGDGIDIDGQATIVNSGLIQGTGAGGTGSDGRPNTSEGIAAGGGTITNNTGASITGLGLGILIDDSATGNAPFATTVINNGTITGTSSFGIRIIGVQNDVIDNSGTISGGGGTAIQLGDGNDTLRIRNGSVITGLSDGQAGTDTLDYSAFTGGNVTVNLVSGLATGTGTLAGFERVIGSAQNDTITGTSAAESLSGGAGNDQISGGAGNDTQTGGAGNDIFVYGSANQNDVITDFGAQYYSATMTGAQENPPNASTATGAASFWLNRAQTTLATTVTLNGLSSGFAAMHLHNAAVGVNGPVVVDIGTGTIGGQTSGTVTANLALSATNVGQLNAGTLYINAHTTNFPGGEVRGQLATVGTAFDRIDVSLRNIGEFATLQDFLTSSGGNAVLSTQIGGEVSTLTINGLGGLMTALDFTFQTAATDDNGEGTNVADDIFGAGGNDTLAGLGGTDRLYGESGNDRLEGGAGADIISGGSGTDTASYAGSAATVQVFMYNTAYNTGDALGDTFTSIEALEGSANIDILVGGFLGDSIFGGNGGDWLDGTYGGDSLYGQDGNDSLVSRLQADTLDGGADFDFARYDYADAALRAYIYDTAQNTGWAAGDTFVSIEGLAGSYFADDLRGDNNQNIIYGLGGADYVIGLGGSDLLIGGDGQDLFHFVGITDGGPGGDAIQDFVSGNDRISVTGQFFGLGSPGGVAIDSFRFVAETAANLATSQFIYNNATQQLFYDIDGTGAGAQVLLATLQAGATMAAGDIIVI